MELSRLEGLLSLGTGVTKAFLQWVGMEPWLKELDSIDETTADNSTEQRWSTQLGTKSGPGEVLCILRKYGSIS